MNYVIKLSLIFLSLVFTACSSTTLIRTTDTKASIYVNDILIGTGVGTHTDKSIVGTTNSVRLEKMGCEPAYYTFNRNEEFDPGACAGGIFLIVPFLWIQKYKAERTYEYNCIAKVPAKK